MRNNQQKSGVVAGILLPLGMVCLFAFCSLALALLGGRAYRHIQGNVDKSYGATLAAGYLHTKLGQNRAGGAIFLEAADDGTQTLVIVTEIQGRSFDTRIFMREGQLVETFAPSGTAAVAGNLIAPLKSCAFEIDDYGLLTAVLKDEDGTITRTSFALTEGGRL